MSHPLSLQTAADMTSLYRNYCKKNSDSKFQKQNSLFLIILTCIPMLNRILAGDLFLFYNPIFS